MTPPIVVDAIRAGFTPKRVERAVRDDKKMLRHSIAYMLAKRWGLVK